MTVLADLGTEAEVVARLASSLVVMLFASSSPCDDLLQAWRKLSGVFCSPKPNPSIPARGYVRETREIAIRRNRQKLVEAAAVKQATHRYQRDGRPFMCSRCCRHMLLGMIACFERIRPAFGTDPEKSPYIRPDGSRVGPSFASLFRTGIAIFDDALSASMRNGEREIGNLPSSDFSWIKFAELLTRHGTGVNCCFVRGGG